MNHRILRRRQPRLLVTQLILLLALLPMACSAEQPPAAKPKAELSPKSYVEFREAVPTSDPERIEVIEVFLYTCPHCYRFENDVNKWAAEQGDDVVFMRMPATFSQAGPALAKAFYTADALGVLDKLHPALFNAIHAQGRNISDKASIKKVFEENGVSGSDFEGTYDSFVIDSKVRRAQQMSVAYGITGVPALSLIHI